MDFGDIRSMMQQAPTQERWEALCGAIEGWHDPVELREHVLPYACAHLRRWPASLRTVPAHWWERFVDSYGQLPWMSIVATVSRRDMFIMEEEVEALGESPWLTELEVLDLGRSRRMPWNRDQLDTEKVRLLTRSPHLGRVRALALSGHHLRPDALYILLSSGSFPGVRDLDLSYNNFGFLRDARLDTTQSYFSELERVRIRDAGLTFVGLELLARCGMMSAPEVDLSENDFGDEGIARWLEVESLEGMRRLELERCGLRPMSLELLSQTPVFRGLQALNLSGNDGLAAGGLASLDGPHLQTLELRGISLEDAGLRALLGAVGSLHRLDLAGNALTDAGVELLLTSRTFPGLKALDLSGNALTGHTARSLARAPCGLRELSLAGNPLDAGAGATLLMSELGRGLERLDLDQTYLTDADLEPLLDVEAFPNLRRLSVRGNTLSADLCRLFIDLPWEIVYDEHLLWDAPEYEEGAYEDAYE